MKNDLRMLPPVHELQKHERFKELMHTYQLANEQLTMFIRQEISQLRERLLKEESRGGSDFTNAIFSGVEKRIIQWTSDRLQPVINGTGTVLHTNLGRARLCEKSVEQIVRTAKNYSALEYQIDAGVRGSRHDIIEDLLKEATSAEAAMVVNNNAAAVFLVLRALAKDQEVIVSRGQLIEIGGSFRVSSIMEESGAYLIEVGTTNKTHLYDYENAISENTAIVMKVHTSNFKTIGFTESVDTEALAALKLAHEELVLYEDLGSGAFFDFRKHGIGDEPIVRDVIKAGADIVSFSGDKLLGGPQAGIIAGKKEIIDRLKKHQLARVLRVDKMTLAGLEQTLKAYLSGEEAVKELPTIRDITRSAAEIKQQAENFIEEIQSKTSTYTIRLQVSTSQVGGGTMPGVELATYVAAVEHKHIPAVELAERLRRGTPAVITRIRRDMVLIDFRTITMEEMPKLVNAFLEIERYE